MTNVVKPSFSKDGLKVCSLQTSGAEYCSDSSLSSAEGESEQRSVILGSRYEKEDAGPWISYLSVCGVMMAR
jgi:hypothetical protein